MVSKVSREKKIIKIRVEVNKIENRKTTTKKKQWNQRSLWKIDKTDQPLAQVIEEKEEDIITQIRKGEVISPKIPEALKDNKIMLRTTMIGIL